MQLYIICCNNLSNTYIKLGKLKDAEKSIVLPVVSDERCGLDSDEVQNELKRAGTALMAFGHDHRDKQSREVIFRLMKEELTENEITKK